MSKAELTSIEQLNNPETLLAIERAAIMGMLRRCDNNHKLAAQRLGVCAKTIRNKLKLYRRFAVETAVI